VKDLFDPVEYAQERYQSALLEVPRLKSDSPQEARVRELFYLNITRFMATLLDRKDRMSMALGLEVRVPFCDHRILEYAWNIPWSMKQYKQREKGILRRALTGILPDDVLWRKKSPYPKTHNPSYLNAVKSLVLDVLADPSAPLTQLIDTKKIVDMTKSDNHAFKAPWFGQLMGEAQLYAYLFQLNTWLRDYKVEIHV
ncbi:MAG: asparagine synthase C-terminal domain-containing protein, partial [Bacillota bacterium]|nr:asparagine synthase C-terminal domain-containing protein [Bacillota bacterium]